MAYPVISIIVPVYNVEQYLPQCIDSIRSQSMSDFELLLVDDGSTDTSGKICDEYASKDNRIHVLHIPNSGVSVARNTGIEESRGEWIVFVDSDDWIDSDYLENFCIDQEGADIVVQGLKFYDQRKGSHFEFIRVSNCVVEEPDLKKKVSDNKLLNWGYPVAKAYRRTLIEKGVRFNTTISHHEDHIFVLNMFAIAQKIRLVESVAYNYRYFHSNTSLSIKHHLWQNMNIAGDEMIKALNGMHDRFIETGSEYERIIYNFAYRPKINAVFEVFGQASSVREKKETIKTIIRCQEIQTYFRPFITKEKIVKFVLCHTPFGIQQLFFTLYINYQNRS